MDSFDTDKAVNARNKANAFTKASAAMRSGKLAGTAAQMFGEAKGADLMADAGAYAQQQASNASMFGNIMGAVGTIGSIGVQGGFGNNFDSFFNPNSYGGTGSTGITTPGKYGSFDPGSVNADLTKYFGAPPVP